MVVDFGRGAGALWRLSGDTSMGVLLILYPLCTRHGGDILISLWLCEVCDSHSQRGKESLCCFRDICEY